MKIITINYAQAAKWSGNESVALGIIGGTDWSGSAIEFRLAVACLRKQWDEAAELMRQAGPNAEELPSHAYVGWPVFREFRETTQFSAMFEKVFGVRFADAAKKENEAPKAQPEPSRIKENNNASGPNSQITRQTNRKKKKPPR